MAANSGFKGAKSARDSFNRLYEKILASQKSVGADGGTEYQSGELSPKKKKTPGKRKTGTWKLDLSTLLQTLWLTLTCS